MGRFLRDFHSEVYHKSNMETLICIYTSANGTFRVSSLTSENGPLWLDEGEDGNQKEKYNIQVLHNSKQKNLQVGILEISLLFCKKL